MKFNSADKIQGSQYFGEFGDVNPSISNPATYLLYQHISKNHVRYLF
jgi:hypothetical protein